MANSGEADSGAPVLETGRLRLRGHRLDDYAALAAIWGDPEIVRFIGGVPSTPHDAWLRLLRYAGLWKLLGYGFWAIEEKAGGCMLGDIGYMDVKRGMTPTLDGMPEVGWVLASGAQGRGYASEALAAVLAWGDAHFGAHRAACIIDPANAPSIRLATKAGFRFAHEATVHGDVVQVFFRDAG
jgi:RimJ/RimL family protein N-acetyltransferase